MSQAPPSVLGGAQVLSVEKLRELLKRLGPQETVQVNALAPQVEEALLALADDFIHRVTHSAALLAQHRNSTTLEVQDLRLLLEKTYRLHVLDWDQPEQVVPKAASASKAAGAGKASASSTKAGGTGKGAKGGTAAAGGTAAGKGGTGKTTKRKTPASKSAAGAGGKRATGRGAGKGGRKQSGRGASSPRECLVGGRLHAHLRRSAQVFLQHYTVA